jgi:hypothetical protein
MKRVGKLLLVLIVLARVMPGFAQETMSMNPARPLVIDGAAS